MYLDYHAFERPDRIDHGDRGEGVGGRVDDDGVGILPRRLDQIDELALVVGLMERNRQSELGRLAHASLPDLLASWCRKYAARERQED